MHKQSITHRIFVFLTLLMPLSLFADNFFALKGRVKESIGKYDLTDAVVLLYDSIGNVIDSVRCNMGMIWSGTETQRISKFILDVPKVDSTYVFDIVCPGYKTLTVTYRLDKIGKREEDRDLGVYYLERAPKELNELTVTTSKIKFYNKGDTIVYNADAFQLAEGSMLDGLISQLPGVELSSDGQITVNGEFVESLLLNGKDFFDGNKKLVLENIAAYTVKDVEVYKGQTAEEKYMGDIRKPSHLTMNVRLKKEYNVGWLINAQGGAGTADRYLGRIFASWFNNTSNVTFVGNVNNLNDSRKPGRNDTWTPDQMTSGRLKNKIAGVTYNHENPEETFRANGSLTFEETTLDNSTTTSTVNFLPGHNTYDYGYGRTNHKQTLLMTRHYIRAQTKRLWLGFNIDGMYTRRKNDAANINGTFGTDHQEMTAQVLEALYSDGRQELLDDVLNRYTYRTEGWAKLLRGSIAPSLAVKLGSGDRLMFGANISYNGSKAEDWLRRDVNYGSDQTPAYRQLQFTDNSPNHTSSVQGIVAYSAKINQADLMLQYTYGYSEMTRDSYMYALDRLEDAGIFGALPDNYLDAFDPSNSYRSREQAYTHSIVPYLSRGWNIKDEKGYLDLNISPTISIKKRSLDYWRDGRDYHTSKVNTTVQSTEWSASMTYFFGRSDNFFGNTLKYTYELSPRLPELYNMIDITDTSNPLYITHGNPDLKTEYKHTHTVKFDWRPYQKAYGNTFAFNIGYKTNALTNGYTYDTTTGVRHSSMYNVKDNNFQYFSNNFSIQFGKTKQFTLNSMTNVNFSVYSDMIGINQDTPSMQKVNYNSYGEKLTFTWQIGQQSISVRGDWRTRHTSSAREGFNDINATHFNYGVNGVFKLPAGFGISTDFICYSRRGYGIDALDTTDPIWNARLSYCPPRNSRWVIMADGFDLLHKLNNVQYSVTAAGRTVSYSNTIPRYFLLTVQYRLNIQPKKK